jgi:gluconolactonase
MEVSRRSFLATAAAAAAATATAPLASASDKWGRDRDWTGVTPVTYPEPAWEIYDKGFTGSQGNSPLKRLWTGALWAEGPIAMHDWGCVIFSDIPNHRTLRWCEDDGHVSVFQTDSGFSNGHTRDRQGRLIACEHDTRRVRRLELDGTWTVLIDRFNGKKLNAPNDAVVASDGAIWFTDPGYGILGPYEGHKDQFELPTNVYRLDPQSGKAEVVVDDFRRPNGICLSPDEKKLYIIDTGATDGPQYPAHIRVFDVDGKTLKNGKVFADFKPGFTDGMRADADGNLWCSWGWGGPDTNGVRVHAPNGDRLAMLHTPEIIANLDFATAKRHFLFMCGSQSIFGVYVNAVGARMP